MTDEQIKQNAHEYAINECGSEKVPVFLIYKKAFIEGAHSRDEEIGELKCQMERQKAIITFDGLNEEALRKELDKLRNSWVSVKVRLPEIDQTQHTKKKNLSIAVLAHDIDILHDALGQAYSPSVVRYDYERKDWLYVELGCYANEVEIGAEITHWMPIPELKKGE